MKKFLYKTLLYTFILAGFGFLLQFIVDEGLRHYDSLTYRDWNKIFQGKINSDIIILGSSRARGQYDPKIIENETGLKCYNLGVGAGKIAFEEARWESLLKYNSPPKFLIKNVDIFSSRFEKNIVFKEQCLPYLSEPTMYPYLKGIDKNVYLENIIPLYKYRGFRTSVFTGIASYFGLIKKPKPGNSYNGFLGGTANWNEQFEKQENKNISAIRFSAAELRLGIDYLQSLIIDCKKKNIEIILVHAPMYYELQHLIPQKDFFDRQISDIAKKNNIQFWDYSQDSVSFSKEYFYNSLHLNIKGAEIFSRTLSVNLRRYIQGVNNSKLKFINIQQSK